jgi:hypothetical protein
MRLRLEHKPRRVRMNGAELFLAVTKLSHRCASFRQLQRPTAVAARSNGASTASMRGPFKFTLMETTNRQQANDTAEHSLGCTVGRPFHNHASMTAPSSTATQASPASRAQGCREQRCSRSPRTLAVHTVPSMQGLECACAVLRNHRPNKGGISNSVYESVYGTPSRRTRLVPGTSTWCHGTPHPALARVVQLYSEYSCTNARASYNVQLYKIACQWGEKFICPF